MENSEDYLDGLLNSMMDGGEKEQDIEPDLFQTEEDFLENYDQKVTEETEENFLSDYETQLSRDSQDDPFFSDEEFLSEDNELKEELDQLFEGIEKIPAEEFEAGMTPEAEPEMPKEAERLDDVEPETEQSVEAETDEPSQEPDTAEEVVKEEATVLEQLEEGENQEDVMDMLSRLDGEDEDLSDIGAMLKADENGERIEDSKEPEQESAPTGDGDIQEPEAIMEVSVDTAEGLLEKESPKADDTSKKEKKEGFFSRLAKLLLGEDDEETETVVLGDSGESEDLASENQKILEELEQAEQADKKGKGKKKKEKKKRGKKKKGESGEEGSEEETPKKEKKKKREKKPKKEKPPKEPSKPLPKKPLVLIIILFASILALILLGLKVAGYSSHVSYARSYYEAGNYTSAYEELVGLTMKEEDQELYAKIRLCAMLENNYKSYEQYKNLGHEDQALDMLVRGIGVYDENYEQIVSYGIEQQTEALLQQLTLSLKSDYGVTYEDAVSLYSIRSRQEYSIEIQKLIE